MKRAGLFITSLSPLHPLVNPSDSGATPRFNTTDFFETLRGVRVALCPVAGMDDCDPGTTGELNGAGRVGVNVFDTTNEVKYVYIAGAWR